MQSGLTPLSESSGTDRSRSSPENPKLPSGTRIPAASTILVPRRASGSNLPRHNPQAESSDTNMEDRVGLGREHDQVLIPPVAAIGTSQMFPLTLMLHKRLSWQVQL